MNDLNRNFNSEDLGVYELKRNVPQGIDSEKCYIKLEEKTEANYVLKCLLATFIITTLLATLTFKMFSFIKIPSVIFYRRYFSKPAGKIFCITNI